MKYFLFTVCCNLLVLIAAAQLKVDQPDPSKKILTVETACGECRMGLHGKSCDLAIRIDGKAYFVDGAHIDSFGDAHANDGFCQAIRKAQVQGTVVGNRFKVTYFKLLPENKKTTGKPVTTNNNARLDFYTVKPCCMQYFFI